MKRLGDCLQRLAPCLGHKNGADASGDGGGAAEEKVDAERGFGQEDRGDEGDEEVGDLDMVSMTSSRCDVGRQMWGIA